MKIIIETADNGYILRYAPEDGLDTYVFPQDDLKGALRAIVDMLGESGSRHDEKRIYIVEAPGDKHERFTEAHANVIWGED